MRSSDTSAVVSVEILVEQNVITPVGVVLKLLRPAVNWSLTRIHWRSFDKPGSAYRRIPGFLHRFESPSTEELS
jgi:hypothetical protein